MLNLGGYPSFYDTNCSLQLNRQGNRTILDDRYRYIDKEMPMPGLISAYNITKLMTLIHFDA